MRHLMYLKQLAAKLVRSSGSTMTLLSSTTRLASLTSSRLPATVVLQQPHVQRRALLTRAYLPRAAEPLLTLSSSDRRCSTVARTASTDEADVTTSSAETAPAPGAEHSILGADRTATAAEQGGSDVTSAQPADQARISSADSTSSSAATAEAVSTVDTPQTEANSANTTATDSISSSTVEATEAVTSPDSSSSSTVAVPKLEGDLPAVWSTFLTYLWERGYFSEHTSANKSSALTSRRDVKKATQQLGRQRPDILHLMPKTLINRLAALQLPFAGDVIISRKTVSAAQRIAAAAASDGVGRASTQDVLRLAWQFCSEDVDSLAVGSATSTVTEVLQSIVDLEQQPPQLEIMKAAAAAAATPNQEQYDHYNLKVGPKKQQQQQQQQQQGPPASKHRGDNRSSSSNSRFIPAAEAPDVPFGVLHKLRMLKLAPFKLICRGDWFCGDCGSHNFAANLQCVGCGVPVGSLGSSTVNSADEQELKQVGLQQDSPFEVRYYKVEFAQALAAAVSGSSNSKITLPEAAKIAGVGKFDVDEALAAAVAAGSIGSGRPKRGRFAADRKYGDKVAAAGAAAADNSSSSSRMESRRGRSEESSSSSEMEQRQLRKQQQQHWRQLPTDDELSDEEDDWRSKRTAAAAAAASMGRKAAGRGASSSSSSGGGGLGDAFKAALADSAAALKQHVPAAEQFAEQQQARTERRRRSAAADEPQQQQQQQPELARGRERRTRPSRSPAAAASSTDAEGDDYVVDDAGPEGLTSSRSYNSRYDRSNRRGDSYMGDDDDEIVTVGERSRAERDRYDADSDRAPRGRYDRSDSYDRCAGDRYNRSDRDDRASNRRYNDSDDFDGADDDLSGWASEFGSEYGSSNRGSSSSSNRSDRGRRGADGGWDSSSSSSSRGGRGGSRTRRDDDDRWGSSSSRDREGGSWDGGGGSSRGGSSRGGSSRGGRGDRRESSSRGDRGERRDGGGGGSVRGGRGGARRGASRDEKPAGNPNWASIFDK